MIERALRGVMTLNSFQNLFFSAELKFSLRNNFNVESIHISYLICNVHFSEGYGVRKFK